MKTIIHKIIISRLFHLLCYKTYYSDAVNIKSMFGAETTSEKIMKLGNMLWREHMFMLSNSSNLHDYYLAKTFLFKENLSGR